MLYAAYSRTILVIAVHVPNVRALSGVTGEFEVGLFLSLRVLAGTPAGGLEVRGAGPA